jgi:hypothetical protein
VQFNAANPYADRCGFKNLLCCIGRWRSARVRVQTSECYRKGVSNGVHVGFQFIHVVKVVFYRDITHVLVTYVARLLSVEVCCASVFHCCRFYNPVKSLGL